MSSARSRSGGTRDREDVEPIEQVLAETALARSASSRSWCVAAMMRTSTLTGSLEPTRSKVISCKHAQQLGLHLQADVADLVEEQRAAVGRLEAADLVADGAGERALDVAEQLAFQQSRRQGGAVDLDEGLAGPRAVLVDGPGQQLLAGAALAADQHGRRAGGHLAHQLQAAAAPAGWSRSSLPRSAMGGWPRGVTGSSWPVGLSFSIRRIPRFLVRASWLCRARMRRCCSAIFSTLAAGRG